MYVCMYVWLGQGVKTNQRICTGQRMDTVDEEGRVVWGQGRIRVEVKARRGKVAEVRSQSGIGLTAG